MSSRSTSARLEGIEVRHARACPARLGGACSCSPGYRAVVRSKRDRRKIQKTFTTPAAAVIWRQDALVDLRRGKLRAPKPTTVREVATAWLRDAEAGLVHTRSGRPYKPSALRGYEQALRTHIVPEFGGVRLAELTRADVQALADRLIRLGVSASTVRNALMPLRAICRRALVRGDLNENPTRDLELPAVHGGRDRIAEPREATALLNALEPGDRPLWATAFYAGLRRGELQALRWSDIDARKGVIHVRRSWDRVAGVIEPKSAAGLRSVPIPIALRSLLSAPEDAGNGFVFGRAPAVPFEPWTVAQRARRAWRSASLNAITLHECRHTYASLMIAAGVNAKALQTFMGHSSITVTLDRYGKLFPGSENEAAVLLNAYLERANV
jgi:integrase